MVKNFFHRAFGKTPSTIIFNTINYFIFLLFSVIMIYPFLYVLEKSLQSTALINGIPRITYSFAAYSVVLANKEVMTAFFTTVIILIIKVFFTLAVSFMMAYALSKKYLKGRKALIMILLITMLFSGGLIPSYILTTQVLQWRNNYLVYIVPGLVDAYNVFVIKSFKVFPIA